eukprot:COSAG01_NODE_22935_length_835_cov_1.588315_2_plen_75_part_00
MLRKLTRRLFEKYKDDTMKDKGSLPVQHVPLNREHIEFLNQIGQKILAQHRTYLKMRDAGYKRGFALRKVADNK